METGADSPGGATGVYLAVTQPAMRTEHYGSAPIFARRVADLAAQAVASRPDGVAVILFPEEIGSFVPLCLLPDVKGARSLDAAFAQVVRARPVRLLTTWARARFGPLKEAALRALADDVWAIYAEAFARAAQAEGAYIVAGTALLPEIVAGPIDEARETRPCLSGRRVYNTTVVFDPEGRIVTSAPKANLVPTQEDHLGIHAGRPVRLAQFEAGGLRFASLVCYDAFIRPHTVREPDFVPVATVADAAGADVLLQPSANPWRWEKPWVFAAEGDGRLRKEQWADESVEAALGTSRHAQYAATSHLTADFLGVRFEGPSAIFERTAAGVRTVARSDAFRPEDGDRFVRACLAVPSVAGAASGANPSPPVHVRP